MAALNQDSQKRAVLKKDSQGRAALDTRKYLQGTITSDTDRAASLSLVYRYTFARGAHPRARSSYGNGVLYNPIALLLNATL
jgi:hypothetical protein